MNITKLLIPGHGAKNNLWAEAGTHFFLFYFRFSSILNRPCAHSCNFKNTFYHGIGEYAIKKKKLVNIEISMNICWLDGVKVIQYIILMSTIYDFPPINKYLLNLQFSSIFSKSVPAHLPNQVLYTLSMISEGIFLMLAPTQLCTCCALQEAFTSPPWIAVKPYDVRRGSCTCLSGQTLDNLNCDIFLSSCSLNR